LTRVPLRWTKFGTTRRMIGMPSYSKPEVVLVRYPFSDLTKLKMHRISNCRCTIGLACSIGYNLIEGWRASVYHHKAPPTTLHRGRQLPLSPLLVLGPLNIQTPRATITNPITRPGAQAHKCFSKGFSTALLGTGEQQVAWIRISYCPQLQNERQNK
jgi:hypothetical protein